MRLLLLPLLLLGSFAYSQFTHSFFGTANQGIPRQAIVAPTNGTFVFASITALEEFPIPGELFLTVGEIDQEGETYDYFRGDLSTLPDLNYCISGYALNNDELIIALIGEGSSYSTLFYVRFNRTSNAIIDVESSPYQLLNGFVRTVQAGNELITYAVNVAGEFIRINTSVSNLGLTSVEFINNVNATASSLISGRKKIDFVLGANGVEFIAREQNIYKRSLNGSYISQIATQWLPLKGYDLALNASNELTVIVGNVFTILDTNNLAVSASGPISNLSLGDYRYLEFIEDQNNYYVFTTQQSSYNTVFYRIDSNMNRTDSINLQCQIRPVEAMKENNMFTMIGSKTEPVSNAWSIGLVQGLLGAGPEPFEEYNSQFGHHNLQANTGHLNLMFHQQANGIHGLGMKHNGIRKSMVFNASNSILGKDANDSITGLTTYFITKDVLPGPYISENTMAALASYDRHNRAFYVTREMIDYHRQFALYPWYEPPFGIKYWPGNGDVINGQAQYIAPYFDENNDGTYEPEEGDYPMIYGDRCYLNVYHMRDSAADNGSDNHLEVHQYMYTYDCDTSEVLKNTIFVNQRFTLRAGVLNDGYVNSYMDADLGNYADDYIGTNVELGMTYVYNGDLFDENSGGQLGYNDTLPACGMMMLKGAKVPNDGMDNYSGVGTNQCTNGLGFGDGITDNEYFTMVNATDGISGTWPTPQGFNSWYNQFKGLKWDGTPFQVNGVDFRHTFYGDSDPQFYSSDGIDPGTSHYEFGPITTNPAGDRRVYGSTGPVDLDANDPNTNSMMITTAYIVAIDTINLPNGNLLAPVDYLFELGSDLKQMYANNDAGCSHDFGPYITQVPVGLQELELNAMLYPNPTFDEVSIVVDGNSEFTATVYDLNGTKLWSQTATNEIHLNTIGWPSGMYMVVIESGEKLSRKKFVKL